MPLDAQFNHETVAVLYAVAIILWFFCIFVLDARDSANGKSRIWQSWIAVDLNHHKHIAPQSTLFHFQFVEIGVSQAEAMMHTHTHSEHQTRQYLQSTKYFIIVCSLVPSPSLPFSLYCWLDGEIPFDCFDSLSVCMCVCERQTQKLYIFIFKIVERCVVLMALWLAKIANTNTHSSSSSRLLCERVRRYYFEF